MEENSIWLVYIYGLYTDLNFIVSIYLVISLVALAFAWIPFIMLADYLEDKLLNNLIKYIINYYKIAAIVLLLNIFIPSRNTLIMMLSAEPSIQAAKSTEDSNTTKSLVNILDNSTQHSEKRSKNL